MLRRIGATMKKDLLTARRDSIVAYLVIAPLLMALLMRIVLPLIEGSPFSFAVTSDLEPSLMRALQAQGQLIVLPDRAAVLERVARIDDVTGVVAGPEPEIVLEGNESANARRVPRAVVDAHAEGRALAAPRPVHGERPVGLILAAVLAFSTLLLAGLASGFTILEEKEHGIAALLSVSPISFAEYALAKLASSAALGLALAVPATAILLDGQIPIGTLLAALLVALPSGLLLGLIVGAFANDQLQAIAMLKGLFFVFTSVPILGFALEGTGWEWTVAPFANHWATQALFTALSEGRLPLDRSAVALLLSLPLVLLMLHRIRHALRLRGA